MITRATAYEIPQAEIDHDCPVAGRVRVGELMSGDSPAAPSHNVYQLGHIDPKSYWIAYIRSACDPGIGPSLVVILSKNDGSILFQGRINDEG